MDGYCVVNRATAFSICAETPGCKYVLTTTDVDWNLTFQNAAMLGKDPLAYDPQWTSCELTKTTVPGISNVGIPEGEIKKESEILGKFSLKAVSGEISKETSGEVPEGRSEAGSILAQQLQHKRMMGSMQIKQSHVRIPTLLLCF